MRRSAPVAFLIALTALPAAAQTPPLVRQGASITLKVPRFQAARDRIAAAVGERGGVLSDGHVRVTEKGQRHGWIRIQVPAAQLPDLLAALREVGVLYGERQSADDRTGEYDELARRAERLRQHQGRLDGILSDRRRRLRGGDLLYVQERLFRASVDEDLLLQRRENVARSAQTSRLVVTLFEPAPAPRPGRRAQIQRYLDLPPVRALPWLLAATVALGLGLRWGRKRNARLYPPRTP